MKQQPLSANRVFIADDQPEVLDLLADKLRSRGKMVEAFPSGARLTERLGVDDAGVELVVLEVTEPMCRATHLVEVLKQKARCWYTQARDIK